MNPRKNGHKFIYHYIMWHILYKNIKQTWLQRIPKDKDSLTMLAKHMEHI